jgi:hypothetical protein
LIYYYLPNNASKKIEDTPPAVTYANKSPALSPAISCGDSEISGQIVRLLQLFRNWGGLGPFSVFGEEEQEKVKSGGSKAHGSVLPLVCICALALHPPEVDGFFAGAGAGGFD